jgi:hypothetical protein
MLHGRPLPTQTGRAIQKATKGVTRCTVVTQYMFARVERLCVAVTSEFLTLTYDILTLKESVY